MSSHQDKENMDSHFNDNNDQDKTVEDMDIDDNNSTSDTNQKYNDSAQESENETDNDNTKTESEEDTDGNWKQNKSEDDEEESGEDSKKKLQDPKEIEKKERQRLSQIRKKQQEKLKQLHEEQNDKVAKEQQKSSQTRFKYLLQQTEIFSHFIRGEHTEKTKKPSSSSQSKFHDENALTEQEEDEEILKETLEDEDTTESSPNFLTVSPSYIKNTELRSYQLEGLNWLIKLYHNGINGILADEMGLGKTIQTIALLGYLKHFKGINGPHLVIAPKSTIPNWLKEINKWCPSLDAFVFHGNKDDRAIQRSTQLVPGKFDMCITTYEMAIKEKSALKKFNWRYVIIDEAHRIKNETSVLSKSVRLFDSQFRLLLTGTPLQNNLHELWALLNFLLPDVFNSAEDFDQWFNLKEGEAETEIVEQLHKVLKPFMLRRLKSDVDRDIPPKKEVYVECGLSEMQKTWYRNILFKDLSAISGSGGDKMRLLNIVMQLRKCCNHPYLFSGAEPGPPYTTGEHLIENCGKMLILDKLLARLKAQGSRILIFSQMTRMLDILEDYCNFRSHSYCRIDGQTESDVRERNVEEFNKPDSDKFVFLLSTRAGGLGINLASADTVIIYDSDWNPQADLQAQDRAHRIGQEKPVNVFRLITKGTVEEKIYQRAVKKLYLDAVVIQQGRLVEQNKKLSRTELLSMVRFGAEEVFRSSDSTITDEDIDNILARGAKKAKEIDEKYKNDCQNNLLNFSLKEDGNLYEYEGMDFSQSPTKSLVVQNVGQDTSKETVENVFNDYGSLRGVSMVRTKATALVHFKGLENAIKAKEALQGTKIDDNEVKISFAKQKFQAEIMSQYVEPSPKRERTVTTRERPTRKRPVATPEKPSGPKLPKQPTLHDFQFYNQKRLNELFEKEKQYYIDLHELKQENKEKEKDKSNEIEEMESKPALSPEEKDEKKKLLAEGFSTWSRKDFLNFIKGCEKHGRDNIESIATHVEGKTLDEVKEYSKVFWSRYKELNDWQKVIKRIEKGESALRKIEENTQVLEWKTKQYANPWAEMKLKYGQNKGKQYTEEEDRFILCLCAQVGYGEWEEMKAEIRKAWEFRFDYFLKSRTPVELQRRCDTLLRIVLREYRKQKKRNAAEALSEEDIDNSTPPKKSYRVEQQ